MLPCSGVTPSNSRNRKLLNINVRNTLILVPHISKKDQEYAGLTLNARIEHLRPKFHHLSQHAFCVPSSTAQVFSASPRLNHRQWLFSSRPLYPLSSSSRLPHLSTLSSQNCRTVNTSAIAARRAGALLLDEISCVVDRAMPCEMCFCGLHWGVYFRCPSERMKEKNKIISMY